MKDQLKTIRTLFHGLDMDNALAEGGDVRALEIYEVLTQLEAMVGEPVATVTSETGNPDISMSWWHEPALPVGTKLYASPVVQQPQAEAVPPDAVRDAERYRWLFSSHTEAELAECDQKSLQPPHTKQDETLALLGGWYTTKEQADKAIDAAIAQQKDKT